jgi:transglutaminase-like putative cysteine protease
VILLDSKDFILDLKPYIGRGFSPEIDRIIATVGVAGIDQQQVQSAVRLCDETEPILYSPDFSPQLIRYRGGRPTLEQIAKQFTGDDQNRIAAAMAWVSDHVVHPHFVGTIRPDRALTEEQLIESGRGYCNEQSRVFIALCGVMQIPARLCFLWHTNNKIGHTATEVFLDGRWMFCDVTYQVRVQLPGQSFAEARELRGIHRDLAHHAYREPLTHWFATKPIEHLDPQCGGDSFESIGICNYLIDGVVPIQEVH